MRKLYFLVPGTTRKFGGGGLWAELKTVELAQKICEAEVVTYRQQEADHLFLDTLLHQGNLDQAIFVVSWGFDVPKLIKKLASYPIIYHAHSSGYAFQLPPHIPIITVSRNTMGYWGEKAAHSLIYYLPNHISENFRNLGLERPIDVLVQTRKSSHYLLNQLVPALGSHCQVHCLEGYVEDLGHLFNSSKIYLYDSSEYWAVSGLTEGFGLPPLEALACGCFVFSSVNHALADYLDPGFNCQKIGGYHVDYDVKCILSALQAYPKFHLPDTFLADYREEKLLSRFKVILTEINDFFDFYEHQKPYPSEIKLLTPWRIRQLRFTRFINKVRTKLPLLNQRT